MQRCRFCHAEFDEDLDRCPECKEEVYKGPGPSRVSKAYKRGIYHAGGQPMSEEELDEEEKKRCFIATVCYGSIDASEVEAFRQWRDRALCPTRTGRAFVDLYYSVSPPLSELVDRSERVKSLIRRFVLSPILHVIRR